MAAGASLDRDDIARLLDEELGTALDLVIEARKAIRTLRRRSGGRKVLDVLSESLRKTQRRAKATRTALAGHEPGQLLAEGIGLLDELRNGVASRNNLDDIDREVHGQIPTADAWKTIDKCVEDLDKSGSRLSDLFESYARQLDIDGVTKMAEQSIPTDDPLSAGAASTSNVSDEEHASEAYEEGRSPSSNSAVDDARTPKFAVYHDNATVSTIQDIAIEVAGLIDVAPRGVAPRARAFNRTVGDQVRTSFADIGLSDDDIRPSFDGKDEAKRARVLNALASSFVLEEREGSRHYRQVAATIVQRDRGADARLLRGKPRVTLDLLSGEINAAMATLERLPWLHRFVSSDGGRGAEIARAAIRADFDTLLDSWRDAIGLNRTRAGYQLLRVVLGVLDYVEEGELMRVPPRPAIDEVREIAALKRWLEDFEENEVRGRSSVIRDEEIRAELSNLFDLLIAIAARVSERREDEGRGRAAAVLEEALSAALGAADALEARLREAGTDGGEGELQGVAVNGERITVGQVVRWARGTAAAFFEPANRTATLRQDELVLLSAELQELSRVAQALAAPEQMPLGLRRARPRAELTQLAEQLKLAAEESKIVAGLATA